MQKKTLTLVTRRSPMALWQADFVKNNLLKFHPELQIEIIGVVTEGDKISDQVLKDIGGKDLFVKELQRALLNKTADIAVHCIKDMSVHPHSELQFGAICERDDPRDVFVSNHYASLEELPKGAVIGTASPRRQSMVLSKRPDLTIKPLRGNVNTRINKLDNNEYDALILAAAGLKRLQLESRIKCYFSVEDFIPAIGQGVLGIECRVDEPEIIHYLKPLHHQPTYWCIQAERAVNQRLGGDCNTPIAAHAILEKNILRLSAAVGRLDGKKIITTQVKGPAEEAEILGSEAADHLLSQGAAAIMKDNTGQLPCIN